jgi:hypothetical protein
MDHSEAGVVADRWARLSKAAVFAFALHTHQERKGSGIPWAPISLLKYRRPTLAAHRSLPTGKQT